MTYKIDARVRTAGSNEEFELIENARQPIEADSLADAQRQAEQEFKLLKQMLGIEGTLTVTEITEVVGIPV